MAEHDREERLTGEAVETRDSVDLTRIRSDIASYRHIYGLTQLPIQEGDFVSQGETTANSFPRPVAEGLNTASNIIQFPVDSAYHVTQLKTHKFVANNRGDRQAIKEFKRVA